MASDVKLRLRLPAGGNSGQAISIVTDRSDGSTDDNTLPAKEWSVTDDVLNISDAACVTVANDDGRNSGKFFIGQMVILDESDPDVAGGEWVRHFTGRVTGIRTYSDMQGGTNVALSLMDLGWHLTSTSARLFETGKSGKPKRVQLRGKTFQQLVDALIDPTWGLGAVQFDGDANARLKHGRQVIVQNLNPNLKAVLPFIQVEIGQSPIDLLRLYASREGLLINVGARGELLFFRPNYENQALYVVEFFPSTDANRVNNNLVGTPTLTQDIEGVYSSADCWSTVVIPPKIQNSENPNEQFRHDGFSPASNPLPFNRPLTFSDQEAISPQLRKNRAKWKWQMGMFQSWVYEVEVQGHSFAFDKAQGGAFYVSNTMISVNDQVNKVSGVYYVQSARRSCTLRDGLRTKLTIRRPGLLNPELEKLGGGARKAAQIPAPVK